MFTHSRSLAALWAAAALSWPFVLAAAEHNPVAREPRNTAVASSVDLIVKLRPEASMVFSRKAGSGADRSAALAKRTGLSMSLKREISSSMLATQVELGGASADEALRRLQNDSHVEYVALDRKRFVSAVPTDPLFTGQWYLQAAQASSVNAIGAWDLEVGAAGVVVAVLDTGILYDHPDLGRADFGGKLLPGFDFISGIAQANDGDGRDADPSDPGDWINDSDRTGSAFTNCEVSGSSWHGTRVAGVIGALSNNASGVAGLSWNSLILPIRVLGKCGGTDSDILAGMRWAAGLHVNGVPDNPTPARVLNLSLGSTGPCEPSYRDVLQELTARKVLVIIAAGNEGSMVSSPANCPGVAAVAAIRHAGSKVGFSNLGPQVTIAAPGGNCVNINGGPCLFSLDTTSNAGATAPAAHVFTDQLNSNLGTSFSAPIVSGITALMLARNNNLSTGQMIARLREGARSFPLVIDDAPDIQACHVPVNVEDVQLEQCLCTVDTCGAGMVNAANSVVAADRPIAAIALPGSVAPGQAINLNASASAAACGRTLAGFEWTVTAPAINPPAINGGDTAVASILAPATGSLELRLTVTDSLGHSDSATVSIEPDSVSSDAPASAGSSACALPVSSGPTPRAGETDPTPPPQPPPAPARSTGGGGGGGSLGILTLILLGVGAVPRFARCHQM